MNIYKILPKYIYFVNMIHRSTAQITTESEVLVTSDYQMNNTIKEHDIDNDNTGSLRSPGGEGSTNLIVGVSITGAFVVLITALVLVFFFRKRKRRNRCKRDSNHKQGYIGNSFISLQLHFNFTFLWKFT